MKGIGKRSDTKKSSRSVIEDNLIRFELRSGARNTVICSALLIILGVIGFCLGIKDAYLAIRIISIISFIAGVMIFVSGIILMMRRRNNLFKYIERFSFGVNNSIKAAVLSFYDPITVVNENGIIQWYNKKFSELCGEKNLYGADLKQIFPEISLSAFLGDSRSVCGFSYNGRDFILHGDAIVCSSDDNETTLISISFSDISDVTRLQKQIEDKKAVVVHAIIDNYDEVLKETPNTNHGMLVGDIERCISLWVEKGEGIYRRYERDKFIILFEDSKFEMLAGERFTVLSDIKEINQQNKIPVTLSIGASTAGDNLKENEIIASSALDMALGRGGDQAVLKDVSGYKFYGARSLGVEKTTKVKARVVAHNLCSLIDSADKVILMGHKNSDYDSFGAAIGLYRAAVDRNKKAYIAMNRGICNVEEILPDILMHEEYSDCIIGHDRAIAITDENTLLIIVDTHRAAMVEYTELLSQTKKVALIDHHRRCEDFIDNTVLTYHEPYASSTCEMVTEILQYMDSTHDISVYEAEALYCGIYMDTKAFTFKTGARTFEAAAYLRKKGVDPVGVRKLFRNDISMYIQKSKIISNAKVYRDNIAIAICDEPTKNVSIVVAQAADDLLNINGVEAAFVLAQVGTRVIISGRSLGAINVQLILEVLGGGGHSTIAGAQLENNSLSIAELRLHNAIDEVLFE
ncbi:MAG: DHH family phosphoesterase [Eubacteriales bacterium]|nr:DHH family phosphoesterase [Eubacteriales bacterium]